MCVLRMHEMHLCACAPNVTKSEVNSVCESLTHACQQDRLRQRRRPVGGRAEGKAGGREEEVQSE